VTGLDVESNILSLDHKVSWDAETSAATFDICLKNETGAAFDTCLTNVATATYHGRTEYHVGIDDDFESMLVCDAVYVVSVTKIQDDDSSNAQTTTFSTACPSPEELHLVHQTDGTTYSFLMWVEPYAGGPGLSIEKYKGLAQLCCCVVVHVRAPFCS
jgi:hypothetical protein